MIFNLEFVEVSLKLSRFRINNSPFYNLGLDRWNLYTTALHWFSLFKHRIQCLTSAQPIAGDRGGIFACSAVTVDTGDTLKDHCLNGPFMRAAGVDIYVEICSGVDIHCIKLKVLL